MLLLLYMNKAVLAVLGLGVVVVVAMVLVMKAPSSPTESSEMSIPAYPEKKDESRKYISWDSSMGALSPYGVEIALEELPDVLEREDIVTVYEPNSGEPGVLLLRRIVGLPGETVQLEGGVITIINAENPEGLVLAEMYSKGSATRAGTWQLAADEYFVMADNRPTESDSSVFGPVKASALHSIYRP